MAKFGAGKGGCFSPKGRKGRIRSQLKLFASKVMEKGMAFEEATSTITALKEDALSAKSQLSAEADDLRNANNKTKLEEREREAQSATYKEASSVQGRKSAPRI